MGGTPNAEEEDDGVVDNTGVFKTLGGHRRHDGRVTAEEALGPATTAGALATGTAGGNSPGSLLVNREAAPRGVRSPARVVLRTRASTSN